MLAFFFAILKSFACRSKVQFLSHLTRVSSSTCFMCFANIACGKLEMGLPVIMVYFATT